MKIIQIVGFHDPEAGPCLFGLGDDGVLYEYYNGCVATVKYCSAFELSPGMAAKHADDRVKVTGWVPREGSLTVELHSRPVKGKLSTSYTAATPEEKEQFAVITGFSNI